MAPQSVPHSANNLSLRPKDTATGDSDIPTDDTCTAQPDNPGQTVDSGNEQVKVLARNGEDGDRGEQPGSIEATTHVGEDAQADTKPPEKKPVTGSPGLYAEESASVATENSGAEEADTARSCPATGEGDVLDAETCRGEGVAVDAEGPGNEEAPPSSDENSNAGAEIGAEPQKLKTVNGQNGESNEIKEPSGDEEEAQKGESAAGKNTAESDISVQAADPRSDSGDLTQPNITKVDGEPIQGNMSVQSDAPAAGRGSRQPKTSFQAGHTETPNASNSGKNGDAGGDVGTADASDLETKGTVADVTESSAVQESKFSVTNLTAADDIQSDSQLSDPSASPSLSLKLEYSKLQVLIAGIPSQSLEFEVQAGIQDSDQKFAGRLDATDELFNWLAGSQSISSFITRGLGSPADNPTTAKLLEIDIDITIRNDVVTEAGNGTAVIAPLRFTTEEAALKKQFGPSTSVDGLDSSLDEIVAALRIDGTNQQQIPGLTTFADLAKFCDIELPGWLPDALVSVKLALPKPVEPFIAHRSAFWLSPVVKDDGSATEQLPTCQSMIRLEFEPVTQDSSGPLQALGALVIPNVPLHDFAVVCRRLCKGSPSGGDNAPGEVQSQILLTAKTISTLSASSSSDIDQSIDVAIQIDKDYVKAFLTWKDPASDAFTSFLRWINDYFQASNAQHGPIPDLSDHIKKFSSTLTPDSEEGFRFRQATLTIKEKVIDSVDINLVGDTSFGAKPNERVGIRLVFTWSHGQLSCKGELLPQSEIIALAKNSAPLNSSFERSTDLNFRPSKPLGPFMDLRYFGSNARGYMDLPPEVPTRIIRADVSMDIMQKKPSIKLIATISEEPEAKQKHSIFEIGDLKLEAELGDLTEAGDDNESSSSSHFLLHGSVLMFRPDNELRETADAELDVDIFVSPEGKSVFSITGRDLEFGALASLFIKGHEQDAVMEMLHQIKISSVKVSYEYQKKQASALSMDAVIMLGLLSLDMHYVRHGAVNTAEGENLPPDWEITASIRPLYGKVNDMTLGTMLGDIAGHDIISHLPTFILNTSIPLSTLDVKFRFFKTTKIPGEANYPSYIIFHLHVRLGDFHLDFVQMKEGVESEREFTKETERMLRITIGKLPSIDAIPLIGHLEAPFEQLHFLWTSQSIETRQKNILDDHVFKDHPAPLMLKDPNRNRPKQNSMSNAAQVSTKGSPEVWAGQGMHFIILSREDNKLLVLLDYCFGHGNHKTKDNPKAAVTKNATHAPKITSHKQGLRVTRAKRLASKQNQETVPNSEKGPSRAKPSVGDGMAGLSENDIQHQTPRSEDAPVQKDISSEEKELSDVGLDSPIEMTPFERKIGPLTISSLGLKYQDGIIHVLLDAMVALGPLEFSLEGLKIELDVSKANIHDLKGLSLHVGLSGLGLEVRKGKFYLAGTFKRIETPTEVGFAGGLSVSCSPYSFLAAGAYIEEAAGYKTVFGFLMLHGPLMSVGWAEVTGITGGFGYNSSLRLPAITEVPSFPLLSNALPGGSDPLVQLSALTNTSGDDAWIKPKYQTIWVAAGLSVKALTLLDVQAVVTIEMGDDFKLGIIGEAVATVPPGKSPDAPDIFMLVDLDVMALLDLGKGILRLEAQLSPASFILDRNCHLVGGFALCAWFGQQSGHEGDWVFSVGGFHPAYAIPAHYPNPPRLGISWRFDDHITISGEAYFAITPQACMGGGRLFALFSLGCISAYFEARADMLMLYKPFRYFVDVGVSMGVSFQIRVWFINTRISVDIGARVTLDGPPMRGVAQVDLTLISFTIHFGADPPPPSALTLEEFWELLVKTSASDSQKQVDDHVFAVSSGLMPTGETDTGSLGYLRPGSMILQIHSRAAIRVATCKNEVRNEIIDTQRNIYSKGMKEYGLLVSNMTVTISLEDSYRSERFSMTAIEKVLPTALWGEYNAQLDARDTGDNRQALNSGMPATMKHLTGIELKPPLPIISPERIPVFSAGSLAKATEAKGSLKASEREIVRFRPQGCATKDKLKGLWGGKMNTNVVDVRSILQAYGCIIKPGKQDVAGRFARLQEQPAKKLYDHFELYYSSGEPMITGAPLETQDKFEGTIAGRWSMTDETSRSRGEYPSVTDKQSNKPDQPYTEEHITSAIRFPSEYNLSLDNEPLKPKICLGLAKIDLDYHYGQRLFVDSSDVTGQQFSIVAKTWDQAVVNDCEVSWLASYDPQVQMGSYRRPKEENGSGSISSFSIKFEKPFQSIPKVVAWLTGLNTTTNNGLSISLHVDSIVQDLFTVSAYAPKELHLGEFSFQWVAYPANSAYIRSGQFSIAQARGNDSEPTAHVSAEAVFDSPVFFAHTPRVLVGLSGVHCGARRNARAEVAVGEVSTLGFRWFMSTGGYSVLYDAEASYIAFE
ncbi:hypothetical protein MMC11_000971 [Xylographa trunciseda]|nr:hypothetical protein [Xylographa trunciseda]